MKISDVYGIVKQSRERIIKTMQERGIVTVQFCPTQEDYEQEHKDDEEYQDYYDYRDEVCPNVVCFDKYCVGYEYTVLQVTLVEGSREPYFRLECEANELGSDTFIDTDVYDMTWVYEMLEKHLEIGDEPEDIWVLFDEQLDDYQLEGRRIQVFRSEADARKAFKETADGYRKSAKENDWEIGNDNDEFFEAYPDGSWGESHLTVDLQACKMNEAVWCHD